MNGSVTKEALRAGGSASGRYEVVTGGASVDVDIQMMFHDQYSYALFEAQQQSLQVRILSYGTLINEVSMENQIATLPPFGKGDKFSLGAIDHCSRPLAHILLPKSAMGRGCRW